MNFSLSLCFRSSLSIFFLILLSLLFSSLSRDKCSPPFFFFVLFYLGFSHFSRISSFRSLSVSCFQLFLSLSRYFSSAFLHPFNSFCVADFSHDFVLVQLILSPSRISLCVYVCMSLLFLSLSISSQSIVRVMLFDFSFSKTGLTNKLRMV